MHALSLDLHAPAPGRHTVGAWQKLITQLSVMGSAASLHRASRFTLGIANRLFSCMLLLIGADTQLDLSVIPSLLTHWGTNGIGMHR